MSHTSYLVALLGRVAVAAVEALGRQQQPARPLERAGWQPRVERSEHCHWIHAAHRPLVAWD